MSWPVAFSIVGTAFAICITLIKVLPCKMKFICTQEFININKRVDAAVEAAWKEVDVSRNDRTSLREEIRDMEKNEVELKTEVAGIHREIKEIKESISAMMSKLDELTRATMKRRGD